jgi:UDP:flavonoid glycosyltransferase YjiC (YdhE family)
MTRFLFVSLPLTGHVNPIAAVARELTRRGHDVAWAGSEAYLRPLIGPEARIEQVQLRPHRPQFGDRGILATKSRWTDYIVPHCRVSMKGVEKAYQAFQPDVIAVDQHAVAGALVAHRHGVPWASLAPTTMELTRPYRDWPRVEDWIREQMAAMWTVAGLPGRPPHDLRFSPDLLVAFVGEALTGPIPEPVSLFGPDPAVTALVGPALTERPPDPAFPFDWLDPDRRHVLVSMGTLSTHVAPDFYRRAVEALRPLADRVQAVFAAMPEYLPDPPDHILVRERVPVLDLLPHLDAVVGHAGLNTVCESLAYGVPLVVAPIKGDQPFNAAAIAAAGAGLRVRFTRSTAGELREALVRVLDDPSFRDAAGRVGASFKAAGGAAAAADRLEAIPPQSSTTAQAAGPEAAGSRPEESREPLESPA